MFKDVEASFLSTGLKTKPGLFGCIQGVLLCVISF
jgi:hypothetical protein